MTDKPLIMFDFDGVIVNTLAQCYEINSDLMEESISLEEYKKAFSGNIYTAFGEKKFKKPAADFHEQYDKKTRDLNIAPPIKKLIEDCAKRYTLGIVSSTPSSSISRILDREGLRECFTDILGSDVDTNKAVKIRMLLSRHDTLPEKTLFITDTSGDIFEAHECGVPVVGVTWGFQSRETLEYAKPLALADTVAELDAVITGFFSGTIQP